MTSNCLFLAIFGISVCLVGHTVGREAIIGGQLANVNRLFPYQVAVHVHGHGHVCGGGIIGDKFVLTAAHCVLNREREFRSPHISVYAGTTNYHRIDPPALAVKVEKIYFPSEYQPAAQHKSDDIAVLMVDPMTLAARPNLERLHLPSLRYQLNPSADIAGFGWRNYRRVNNRAVGSADGRLRYAVARILINETCIHVFNDEVIIPDRHLCARAEQASIIRETSTCTGDDGSPLVQDGTVIGILSRLPYDCDEQEYAAVYTRVSHYRKFINSAMQGRSDPSVASVYPFP